MDRQVLVFFTDLLGKLDRPLLHHVSIHQPVLVINYEMVSNIVPLGRLSLWIQSKTISARMPHILSGLCWCYAYTHTTVTEDSRSCS